MSLTHCSKILIILNYPNLQNGVCRVLNTGAVSVNDQQMLSLPIPHAVKCSGNKLCVGVKFTHIVQDG